MSHLTRNSGSLSRRKALKILVAATGAVTLSNLPKEWVTPVIEVGQLPVHAQGSLLPLTISNLEVGPPDVNGLFVSYQFTFNYDDPLGLVDADTRFLGFARFLTTNMTQEEDSRLGDIGAIITGDGVSGTISVVRQFFYGGEEGAEFRLRIRTLDGRTSNELETVLDNPLN